MVQQKFSATAQEEYEDYQELFGVLSGVQQQGTSIFELDSLQKEVLYAVATKEENRSNAWARNILMTADTLSYLEPVLLPTYLKSSAIIPVPAQEPAKENILMVYPNPAKSYFIVRYELDNHYAEGSLLLSEMSGRIVRSFNTDMLKDYIVVPTKDLVTGTYIIKLILNGREIGVQKVTIK